MNETRLPTSSVGKDPVSKVVVSSEEAAAAVNFSPAFAPRPPLTPPLVFRLALAPLALILPLLSFATIVVWLATRRMPSRSHSAWMTYCCGLLVASGLISSIGAGFFFFTMTDRVTTPGESVPFTLDGPTRLSDEPKTATLSPRELADLVKDAVFIVAPADKWLKPTQESLAMTGFGTAVLLYAGKNGLLLATNRHVIDGENWENKTSKNEDVVLFDRKGGVAAAKVVGRHNKLDLLLLEMPNKSGLEFAQSVLPFDDVAPGESIMIFGHPEGLFFSLSDGLISRKEPGGRLQISAPVSPGASGGPVYDFHKRLLGIVSGMMDKRSRPDSENLNFAVRADAFLHPDQWKATESALAALKEFVAASTTPAPAPTVPTTSP